MLRELDRLVSDLAPKRSEGSHVVEAAPAPAVAEAPVGAILAREPLEEVPLDEPPATRPPTDVDGARDPGPAPRASLEDAPHAPPAVETPYAVTPYLEERLRLANVALGGFGAGLDDLDARSASLRETAQTLEQELRQAQRELDFLRGSARLEEERPLATAAPPRTFVDAGVERPPSPRVWSTGRVAPGEGALRGRPMAGAFGEYTTSRYNRTISDLKARRRRLATYTVAFAALISTGLLILTFLAREPMPPLYVAILPAVWMVPVPFFLASFLGTHRVLRRNHLNLPGP